MLMFAMSIALCVMLFMTLRGGLVSNRGFTIQGLDAGAIGLGGIAFLAAWYFMGPMYGIAFVLSVMVHEYGHVVAFRIAGHDDARFRLIPLMGGVAISDKAPETQRHDFFISLMGPGICIVPMVLSLLAYNMLWDTWRLAAEFFWHFAVVTGALNFFNLLPFWPLDGGRCVRIIVDTFAPKASLMLTLAMSAGLAATGVWLQSTALLVFACLGAIPLFSIPPDADEARLTPLSKVQGLLALAAYLATMAVHFMGGLILIKWFIS